MEDILEKFCKERECPILGITEVIGKEHKEVHCTCCKANMFYVWLQKNGYKITKEEEE